MSYPANPPPYDVIYTQGVQSHPVQVQPQPQMYVVQHHQVTNAPGVVVGRNILDFGPSVLVCQSCSHLINTRVEIRPGFRTHACAVCLFFCGLWPCCFVPYCIPSCNNVDHYCPKCNAFLGSYTG